MQYLKLTEKAKDFITSVCDESTDIFTKVTNSKLPKSNIKSGVTFNATMFDDNNVPIITNEDYAKNLIIWLEYYAEIFLVDPNIAAAQLYQESRFLPLSYSGRNTLGVSGLVDYEIFNILFNASDKISDSDVDKITVGITGDPYQIQTWIPYLNSRDGKTKSYLTDNITAINNRPVLYQNLANNPKLGIYCQFYLLSQYGARNKNLAATSLFCYYVRSNESFDNYSLMLDFMKKKFNTISGPKDYVNKIFLRLSDFGYAITFDRSLIPYTSDPDNPKNNERLKAITVAQLKGVCPHIPEENVAVFLKAINANLAKFQINTRLRIAHFMAQIGHESGDLTQLTENLNYSAKQLMRVSPFNKYFKTIASTVGYVGFPEKIANIGYSNRTDIGNGPDPDGYVFRGRGAIGVTGRKRYQVAGEEMGLDLISNPDLLSEPTNAIVSAFYFWRFRNLNSVADTDNIDQMTVLINGGYNGFDDRIIRTKRAKIVFGIG